MLVAVTQGVHTALFSEGFCGTDLMGQNCPFAPGFPLFQFWVYFGFLIFFFTHYKGKKGKPKSLYFCCSNCRCCGGFPRPGWIWLWAAWSAGLVTLHIVGGWNQMVIVGLSNPGHSVVCQVGCCPISLLFLFPPFPVPLLFLHLVSPNSNALPLWVTSTTSSAWRHLPLQLPAVCMYVNRNLLIGH